jgi:GH35 family endo-1,4-beta-xylanase
MSIDHRSGEIELRLLDRAGVPLRDTLVTVEQERHAFAFGNIAFDMVRMVGGPDPAAVAGVEGFGADAVIDLDRYAALWLGLFDTATLPFYWGRYEPVRGEPDTERLRRTADWLAARGVRLKGHPLVWHTVQPEWLLGMPLDEVERSLRARIREVVSGFAGRIDMWDAINEAVIMPVFANGENAITPLARARGRIHMVRLAFEEARGANPSATLVLNDFDLSSAYECLIEGVLEAGIEVDALGLQTHMHQGYRGEEATLELLERFARYGLPIQMTETSLVSGHLMPQHVVDLNDYRIPDWPTTPEGEERQADEIVRHYRTLVGHPAVTGITYWGLTDSGAWLGAPVGLVRRDGSPKPAYEALRRLVRGEWWLAPTEMRTDASGTVRVRGFGGDYRVASAGASAPFAIAPGGHDRPARLDARLTP